MVALDPLAIATGLVAGVLLGAAHLGGLWLTVRALPKSRLPGLLLLGSFAARTSLVVAGAALVASGNWQTLAATAPGFLIARLVATRAIAQQPPATDRSR